MVPVLSRSLAVAFACAASLEEEQKGFFFFARDRRLVRAASHLSSARAMALVNVTNISLLNNPSSFDADFQVRAVVDSVCARL